MASTTPFRYKDFPICPGAYLINTSYGAQPIFCSIANFQNCGYSDIDNIYIVMPGYKLTVYQDFYSNSPYDITNTNGIDIVYVSSTYADRASSCSLFFKDVEVKVDGIS